MKPRSNNLGRVGERRFISRILPGLSRLFPSRFVVPPGDDAAVLAGPNRPVLSIDGLTEGTHFRLKWAPLCRRYGLRLGRALGWKLMGSALSDLAAMGDTRDRWAMVYLGGPGDLSMGFLADFYHGVRETALRHDCVLAGGDTVRAKELTLVAAVGGRAAARPLARSGARPGDLLCIAGTVGDAAAGLRVLEGRARLGVKAGRYFVSRFFRAEPMFAAGKILARAAGVGALMDLSDDIDDCLSLMTRASGVGATLDVESIPVSAPYRRAFGLGPRLLAAGEDYALLFTLRPSALKALRAKLNFSVVGRIERRRAVEYLHAGAPCRAPKTFEQFGA